MRCRTYLCSLLIIGTAFVSLATSRAAVVQFPPDSFENLQVLPADIQWEQLHWIMRGFSSDLGRNDGCLFCHVGESRTGQATWDFVSDEKPTKRTAREMLRMVQAINGQFLAELPNRGRPRAEVTCDTCHAGRTIPRTLEDELLIAYSAGGKEAMIERYGELRDRYYGSGSYDFRRASLLGAAIELTDSGQLEAAIAALELNARYYPDYLRGWRLWVEYSMQLTIDNEGVDPALVRYRDFGSEIPPELTGRVLTPIRFINLGDRLIVGDRAGEAIELLQGSVRLYPDDFTLHDKLGEAYAANDDVELAIASYTKSLELNPENGNAVEMLRKLMGGTNAELMPRALAKFSPN